MSPLDPPVPPTGEEIHLPGQSVQPLLLAGFITMAVVGITTAWWLVATGGFFAIVVIIAWVRGARRELEELPVHDEH